MQPETWTAVDEYFAERLIGPDGALDAARAASAEAGLPDIAVSPNQGKLLHLLARLTGARRVLEVGTLGGYSTIWLARALPEDGELITLEANPAHAEVAAANLAEAGLAERVQVLVGPALDTLPGLTGPFDLVFIDADKQNNPRYLQAAQGLSRPGTLIVVDNVVRGGRVADLTDDRPETVGSRGVLDVVAAEPRLDGVGLQTVGTKGYDGMVLALVR